MTIRNTHNAPNVWWVEYWLPDPGATVALLCNDLDWVPAVTDPATSRQYPMNLYRLGTVRQPCLADGRPTGMLDQATAAQPLADVWLSATVQFVAEHVPRPDWWDVLPTAAATTTERP